MLRPLIVVGASMGGLDPLQKLLQVLPPNFPAAMVVVLHRGVEETGLLLPMLQQACVLPVSFPLDKEPISAARVFVAPPNYHLLIEDAHFTFTLDAPENNARPSIDILFQSAAQDRLFQTSGVVLSGLGRDGASGLAAIAQAGGLCIVQQPDEAAQPEMPLAALVEVPGALQMTIVEIQAWLGLLH